MNKILQNQIKRATKLDGGLSLDALFQIIQDYYEEIDRERKIKDRSIEMMSQELNELNSQIRKSAEDQVRLIIKNVYEGILFLDESFFPILVNDSTYRIFKIDFEDKKWEELKKKWEQVYKKLNLETGLYNIVNQFELPILDKKHFFELSINPINLFDRSGFIAFLRDITFQKEESLLFEKNQQYLIKKIEKTESDFIYLTKYLEKESKERKAAEASLEFLAYHDPLTGLLNRPAMSEYIENCIKFVQPGDKLALLFIDLEKFKLINDFLGPHIGDELLRRVSIRLENCLKAKGKVSRQGGDEFLVLVQDFQNLNEIRQLCEDITQAIKEPYLVYDHELSIDLNIGIAIYPDDGIDGESLSRSAGVALRKSKDSKEKYTFYNTDMSLELYEQLVLRNWLKLALTNGQLKLYYQPKLHLATNQVKSVEALLRWEHPERGLISPTRFIPIAEQMGLIIAIGFWVFENACIELNNWNLQNPPQIAINLSPIQFNDPNLVRDLEKIVNKYKIKPELLELEITESGIMTDINYTINTLHTLRSMGFTLTIDDFGTGYSSLSYLKRFPVHNLKIDKSFIVDVPYVEKDCALVKSIVQLSKGLGLYVIVEGIEQDDQKEFIESLGVDAIQGFIVSKPISGMELLQKYFL
jgi:diguanylate cyclase (GGDEF)-like protein